MTDININLPDIPPESQKFLARIFGPLADVGDLLSDKIRFYRWKSSLATIRRAEAIAREHNISVQEVPLRTLVPLIEKSSLEQEDSPLIQQWANILAQASSGRADSYNAYIDILSRLSYEEVSVLERFIDSKFIEMIFGKEFFVTDAKRKIDIQLAVNIRSMFEFCKQKISSKCSGKKKSEYYDELKEFFHVGIYELSQLVIIEKCICSFDLFEGDNIFSLSHDYPSDGVDILFSTGLVNRGSWTVTLDDAEISISFAAATALGVKFVMACRGDTLEMPVNK